LAEWVRAHGLRAGGRSRAPTGLSFDYALLSAPRRGAAEAPRPVPRERDAPHRGGDGPRGVRRQRVDPLPPPLAVPGEGARRLRADRARGVAARAARPPPLQYLRHAARGRRDHGPEGLDVERRRGNSALPTGKA